jgi:hypothetical protein
MHRIAKELERQFPNLEHQRRRARGAIKEDALGNTRVELLG